MIKIYVPETESYNELTNEFITTKATVLSLEHSLSSLAKWESKWKKPFLTDKEHTRAEMIDYVRCMTLGEEAEWSVYTSLSRDTFNTIAAYINDTMTATWFNEKNINGMHKTKAKTAITAEIIYYWMISLNIPFECEKWHLNRLLTLIRVCSIKNQPSKKMSKRDALKQNAAINAARRKPHV